MTLTWHDTVAPVRRAVRGPRPGAVAAYREMHGAGASTDRTDAQEEGLMQKTSAKLADGREIIYFDESDDARRDSSTRVSRTCPPPLRRSGSTRCGGNGS